jgi:hypothetical protein
MKALIIITLLLSSCTSAQEYRFTDGDDAPAPFGYTRFCKDSPEHPICR